MCCIFVGKVVWNEDPVEEDSSSPPWLSARHVVRYGRQKALIMNVASPSSSPEVSGGDYLALALPGGGAGGATGAVALGAGREKKVCTLIIRHR